MPWRESPAELSRARDERPVVVPSPCGDLFGIYTPPAPGVTATGLCTVMFTRPRSHRNRMWVEGARRLAAKGFSCFRFDYHGTGDSAGATEKLDMRRPYREDAVAVIRHLREHFGARRFVLCGSCFDARTALSAFADEADVIEGLVFIAAPVMETDDVVRAESDRKDWAHIWRALRKPRNWKVLGDVERWKYMATVLSRVATRSGKAEEPSSLPLSAVFLDHFQALVGSGARALFLYGADDPEYLSFQVAERLLWPELPAEARRRFDVVVWPGVVHTGTLEVTRQREIVEKALGWIESLSVVPSVGLGKD